MTKPFVSAMAVNGLDEDAADACNSLHLLFLCCNVESYGSGPTFKQSAHRGSGDKNEGMNRRVRSTAGVTASSACSRTKENETRCPEQGKQSDEAPSTDRRNAGWPRCRSGTGCDQKQVVEINDRVALFPDFATGGKHREPANGTVC